MTDSLSLEQKPKTNTSRLHVLRDRNFHLLWMGKGASLLGDQLYLIALPWLVLALTGDALALKNRRWEFSHCATIIYVGRKL